MELLPEEPAEVEPELAAAAGEEYEPELPEEAMVPEYPLEVAPMPWYPPLAAEFQPLLDMGGGV